jgi:hypothetical protein
MEVHNFQFNSTIYSCSCPTDKRLIIKEAGPKMEINTYKQRQRKNQGNLDNIKNLISTITPEIMRLGKITYIHNEYN